MHFIKKQRNKLLYKQLLPLRKNIQNREKLLRFKKKNDKNFNVYFQNLKKRNSMTLFHTFYLILKIFLVKNLNTTYIINKD